MAEFGVIYASGSKMIRRIIAGSDNLAVHVGVGETLLTIQQAAAPNIFEAEAAVEAATGQSPLNLTCAVIDGTGNVVGLVKADPEIDQLPAKLLVAAPSEITTGCTYDSKTAAFTIPQKIIPAYTDRDGKPVAQQTIVAKTVMPVDVAAEISAAQAGVVNP